MNSIIDTAQISAATPLRDVLCQKAIGPLGRLGFDRPMAEIAAAANVDEQTLIEHFGSVEGLRAACDDYLQATVRVLKTEALTSRDTDSWLGQITGIEAFAPMMSYLVRSLQTGDEHARVLLQRMTDNVEAYLNAAVDAGTVKPSRDAKARARFLAMCSGGGFLLYLMLHNDPDDMAAVLRDYARDMMMPALELYTQGADDRRFDV